MGVVVGEAVASSFLVLLEVACPRYSYDYVFQLCMLAVAAQLSHKVLGLHSKEQRLLLPEKEQRLLLQTRAYTVCSYGSSRGSALIAPEASGGLPLLLVVVRPPVVVRSELEMR